MAARVQRKRTPGWRAPLDEHGRKPLYVGRGTRWGNPARVIHAKQGIVVAHDSGSAVGTWPTEQEARRFAAESYRHHLKANPDLVQAARQELAGRSLMCWCPLPEPNQPDHCHAAVLLEFIADPPGDIPGNPQP
jgi:uncharacterized protein DUF4326